MKKFVLILLAVCLAGGTVMAQDDDGIGVFVGAELTIPDLKYADEAMLIRPYVGFEKSFDAFDLYVGLGIPIYRYSYLDYDDTVSDTSALGLDLCFNGTYNLGIGNNNNLAFGFGTWMYLPFDSDKGMYTEEVPYGTTLGSEYVAASMGNFSMHFNFGALFTMGLGSNDLYFGADIPFILTGEGISVFQIAEFNLTAGMDMESGLGFGLTLYNWIGKNFLSPVSMSRIQNLDLFVTYESGPFAFGLTFGFPLYKMEYSILSFKGMKIEGITITPEFEFNFDFGLSLYASLPIYGIGSKDLELFGTTISEKRIYAGLTVGAKFSF